MARDVLDDAELLLEAVLTLAPDYRAARHDYALVLVERHKYLQARAQLERCCSSNPTIATTARSTPPPASASASTTRRSRSTASCCADAPRAAGPASVDRALRSRRSAGALKRSRPTAPPPRPGRVSATPTGASPTSRPTASPTRRSRACAPRRRRPRRRSSIATTCASRSARRYEDRGEYRRVLALLRARQRAEARGEPLPPGDHREQHAQADRGLHARVLRRARRAWGAAIPIRSSSSACRARARRCSSRSSPRTRRSRARRSSPTFSGSSLELQGRDPDLDNPRYPAVLADLTRRGFPAARRELPRRHAGLPHRQAVLHRQDAEQLPAHRPHPPDAAERQDHRCAARADGLLLQQS